MTERTLPDGRPALAPRRLCQLIAMLVCVVLGVAMIVNNQLGGEAMWFWYATVFHRGAHLYSQLHTPLQPLFVLETDLWMRWFGTKVIVTQIPSLLHMAVLLLGFYLVLRESSWPDWQKGIVLLSSFTLTVGGHSYRFDDYHVIAEFLILYCMWLLLVLWRTHELQRQMALVAALGLLTGLSITTRVTDGLALLVSGALCLVVIARQKKAVSLVLFLAVASATVLLVVRFTGDTVHEYLNSTIFRAAASKGGTGSLSIAPLITIPYIFDRLHLRGGRLLLALVVILGIGPLVSRFWRAGERHMFALQVGVAALLFLLSPAHWKHLILTGTLLDTAVLCMIAALYVIAAIVAFRMGRSLLQHREWDTREVLYLLCFAEWASYSAGAGGEPLTNYYAPVAMLMLLVAVLRPFQHRRPWVTSSFLSLLTVVGISCITSKILIPYSWQNYVYSSMFVNRQIYHHPVYGLMYIDTDLLQFSERVCSDIHSSENGLPAGSELLSLPYPYPNFFCATPPWHNYVQTFFDTSTRQMVQHLMTELNTAPPEWIVYQRQLGILHGAERLYNHKQPLAQEDLDALIFSKLASGEWILSDQSEYLGQEGGGWYIIHTRPAAPR